MGFGLVNRFIDHLLVVTTSNYNSIADFHTTNHCTLSSQSAFTSHCLVTALNSGYSTAVFTRCFLVMHLNNEDSLGSMLTSLLSGEYPTNEL
jgi:hypothetical protein